MHTWCVYGLTRQSIYLIVGGGGTRWRIYSIFSLSFETFLRGTYLEARREAQPWANFLYCLHAFFPAFIVDSIFPFIVDTYLLDYSFLQTKYYGFLCNISLDFYGPVNIINRQVVGE